MTYLIRVSKLAVFLLLFGVGITAAQVACGAIMEDAIDFAVRNCDDLEPDQVCYGNGTVGALGFEDGNDVDFSSTGDIAPLADVASLRLTSDSAPASAYSIVPMQIGVFIDEETTASAHIIFFGNVDAAQQSLPEPITATLQAAGSLNVRAGDSTDNRIVGALAPGDVIEATGRNEAGDWVRFIQEDETSGWVYVPLTETEDDVMVLPVVEGAAPSFRPMQVFTTANINGLYDRACEGLPHSGLLLQAPEEVEDITFVINNVELTLTSTAFITTEAPGNMFIYILDGDAQITSGETTLAAAGGSRVSVSMNIAREPISDPFLQPYEPIDIEGLPLSMLPIDIDASNPLTAEQAALLAGEPQSGRWLLGDVTLNNEVSTDLGANIDVIDCTGSGVLLFDKDGIPLGFDIRILSNDIEVNGREVEDNDMGGFTQFDDPTLIDDILIIPQQTWVFTGGTTGEYIYEIATRNCPAYEVYRAEMIYEG